MNELRNSPSVEAYRHLIERLPLTIRPSLHQQLDQWEMLFPFEQNRIAVFFRGVEALQPAALDGLTAPLRALEGKMGVARWNFTENAETMENASQLARSAYYAEWRGDVQKVFDAINSAARDAVPPSASPARLLLLILPQNLPLDPKTVWKGWDGRGSTIRIAGDARKITELALQDHSDLPALLTLLERQGDSDSSNLWLIDAEAKLNTLLPVASSADACRLSLAALRPFRDQFLADLNTIPKNIQGADQIIAAIRQKDWQRLWPADPAGEARLRNFVLELFLSGNGALIYPNSFVEWSASEALRRARPRVVVARFGMRSKPGPFTSIAVFENQQSISALPDVDDPEGSAVDAAILARYIWLAASRYPEGEHTYCLCVAEHASSAFLIAPPGMTTGWSAEDARTPEEIYRWVTSHLSAS